MAWDEAARREFADRLAVQSAQMAMMADMTGDPLMREELLAIARSLARQAREFGLIDDRSGS